MRPKLVIGVLLALFGAIALLLVSVRHSRVAKSEPSQNPVPANESSAAESIPPANPPPPTLAAAPAANDPTNNAANVRRRVEELNALAMNNDPASLDTILSELRNPDRQIRQGALAATIQFSDRAAIPQLREIAAQTDDEQEKEQLLEAANYLALPSLTEVMAQQGLGISNAPGRDTNRLARRNPAARLRPSAPVPPAAIQ